MQNKLTKIGVFYDGNYFLHISNYYNYVHERQSRISISGLHDFISEKVSEFEDNDPSRCRIIDGHYFRGRLNARDASQKGNKLYFDRVFDDILMLEGVTTHYSPIRSGNGYSNEKGIDTWLALETYEQAMYKQFDVIVLIACDGDYVPLVRKLHNIGCRVMLLAWDFEFTDDYGNHRTTKTSSDLIREVTYPVSMHELIEEQEIGESVLIDRLFVPPKPVRTYEEDEGNDDDEFEYEEANTIPVGNGVELDGDFERSFILTLKNGYGFIKFPPDNLFFHYNSVQNIDFNELQPGQEVQFRLDKNDEGEDVAVDVSPLTL